MQPADLAAGAAVRRPGRSCRARSGWRGRSGRISADTAVAALGVLQDRDGLAAAAGRAGRDGRGCSAATTRRSSETRRVQVEPLVDAGAEQLLELALARRPRPRTAARRRPRSAARRRACRPGRRAGSSPARQFSGNGIRPDGFPTYGESSGSVISTRLALPWRKVNSRTRSPTVTASSTSADMIRGVETLTSTPQASVNSHSLLGWLTRPTVRGTRELGLGQQRGDQVGLVVAGRGDHHVALVELGLLERGQLAGVGEQPLGVGHPLGLDRRRGPCR